MIRDLLSRIAWAVGIMAALIGLTFCFGWLGREDPPELEEFEAEALLRYFCERNDDIEVMTRCLERVGEVGPARICIWDSDDARYAINVFVHEMHYDPCE